jgi:S-adenosylmethionine:tRNA ribosyltransferase-isomerase
MRVSELDYELPRELIAQHPAERRDASRLLVYERSTGAVRHRGFVELPDEVPSDRTLTVVNDTRVLPVRIRIDRPRGEVLLLEQLDAGVWEALARPTRRLRPGRRYGPVELVEHLGAGRWLVRLDGEPDGEAPLPPYITEPLADPERYQTVYAREPGSAAAPTAGLHFTPGFEFRRVDHLLTNFHLPRSTLLALVMAFAGVEETRRVYEIAVEERYRFYSFGDAMLIL